MHGLSTACDRAVVYFPPLPAPAFDRSGSVLGKLPARSSLEARISARPFTPPQRQFSFENRLGEIAAPGLYLRFRSAFFLRPVRSGSPLLLRFWRTGEDQHSVPVA